MIVIICLVILASAVTGVIADSLGGSARPGDSAASLREASS
jgi:hypothetical protein